MIRLTKKKEQVLRSLYASHGRKKYGMCVCEGVRACGEFLNSPMKSEMEFMVVSEDFEVAEYFPEVESNIIFRMPQSEFKKITHTKNSQGVLIVVRRPDTDNVDFELGDEPFSVLLDGISDPGNMGTILRTVKAVGLKKVYMTKGSVDAYGDKVIRSAMAAQFFLDIRVIPNFDIVLQAFNNSEILHIWRTDCHKGESIFEVKELFNNSLIVFGSEAFGASEIQKSKAVTIPMPGNSESINLAQAVTIFLFEAVRRGIL